jgi:hypothetical protein
LIEPYLNNINIAFALFDLTRPLPDEDLKTALEMIDRDILIDDALEGGLDNPYNKAIIGIKKSIQELK